MVKYDMTREEREDKSKRIREKGEATRLRHALMRPLTVELKLDLKCLSNAERSKLFLYFTECRWLCNYLLGLSSDMLRDFDTRTRCVTSLDMTQKAFANVLGVSKRTVEAWETGRSTPSPTAKNLINLIAQKPELVPMLQEARSDYSV